MGHFSVEISQLPGSVLSGNQHPEAAKNLIGKVPADLRDAVLYNQLLAKLPHDDFDGAKAVWTEMKTLEPPVAPDPYTCAEIAKRAPTIEAGLEVLDELIARGGEPNSYAYEPLMKRAASPEAARDLIGKVPADLRDAVLYNQLLAKLPHDDFDGAKAVWTEMKTLEPPVAPDPYTCAEIAKRAPTIEAGLEVLDELIARGGEPNSYAYIPILHKPGKFDAAFTAVQRVEQIGESVSVEMSTVLGSKAASIEEMDRARDLLLPHQVAGHPFYSSVYLSCACNLLTADELLDWAFKRGATSFSAFQTAIKKYMRLGKLEDALRVASAFPHFPVCRQLFQRFPDAAESYLIGGFEAGPEPANAAAALGYFYKSTNRCDLAITWFNTALEQSDVSEGKKRHVQKELNDLAGSSS